MSDPLAPLLIVLAVAFVAGLLFVLAPWLRAEWAVRTAEVAEQVAVLAVLPLDAEPHDFAAGAAGAGAAAARGTPPAGGDPVNALPERVPNGLTVLDLFCNAGGAAMGYYLAGFEVVGVDVEWQPNYPFPMRVHDALGLSLAWMRDFDFVHASPPCQHSAAITKGTNRHRRHLHPDLYPETLMLLGAAGLPYVIENPAARADVTLCGEMFGLEVLRHRRIELGGWTTPRPAHPRHRGYVRGWRHGVYRDGPYLAAYGKGGGKASAPEMQAAMGIGWTDVHAELVEMLPPAYTRWIGERAAAHILAGRTAVAS
jgi:hypothetical protein